MENKWDEDYAFSQKVLSQIRKALRELAESSIMNIKFSYLYRDAGNYKNFGEVIFANPQSIPIEELVRIAV